MSSPPIINITNTITNQNKSLNENLKYLQNINSADQQQVYYNDLQTEFLHVLNFYLFYLYLILAVFFGYYWFYMKKGYSFYLKIFWYLHVIGLPYLLIYSEFVAFYMFNFVYFWITGTPFYPWRNYTSYPPLY
jgi:hypothetical protein